MKQIVANLFAVFLMFMFVSPLFAGEETKDRININFAVDEAGRFNPDIFMPIHWTENYYSGIGYRSSKTTDSDVVEGFDESRLSTTADERRIKLNLLSYETGSERLKYSIGGEIEHFTIERKEFGYIHFPASLGDDWVAFDNDVDITLTRPYVRGDLTWLLFSQKVNLRIGGRVSPSSTLKVEQETRFKPIVTDTGTNKSNENQDLSYEITFDGLYKTGTFIDFAITAGYEFLPLKYDLATLAYDSGTLTYSFENSTIKAEETTLSAEFKLLLDVNIIGFLKPAIGYGIKKVETKDKTTNNGTTKKETTNFLLMGFEKKF